VPTGHIDLGLLLLVELTGRLRQGLNRRGAIGDDLARHAVGGAFAAAGSGSGVLVVAAAGGESEGKDGYGRQRGAAQGGAVHRGPFLGIAVDEWTDG
jgi:hypothetical protein